MKPMHGNLTVCYGNSPFKIVFFNISMGYRTTIAMLNYRVNEEIFPVSFHDLPNFIQCEAASILMANH